MIAVVAPLLLALQAPQQSPGPLPAALRHAERATSGTPVETEMRRVFYRAAPNAPIVIHYLRGTLAPTREGVPPWLEDRASFEVVLDTGSMSIDGPALAALMNDHVLNYDGAPLRGVSVHVLANALELKGRVHGLGFTMRAVPELTADGRIRLTPSSVKVVGIGVRGLMRRLGIALDDVMKLRGGRGVEVRERDIIIEPGHLVPQPRLRGRLTAIGLRGGRMQLAFGRSARGGAPPLAHPAPPGRNYVCYHGGVLRFGKLIMQDAELEIADADERDLFDLSLAEFNRQLIAGYTRNQSDFGLKTTMPDFGDLPAPARRP